MHPLESDDSNQNLDTLYAIAEMVNKKLQICVLDTNVGAIAAVATTSRAISGLITRFAADAGASKRDYRLLEYGKKQELMSVKSLNDKRFLPSQSVTEAVQTAAKELQDFEERYETEYLIKDLFKCIEKYRDDDNAPHFAMQNIKFGLTALLATARQEGYKEGYADGKKDQK